MWDANDSLSRLLTPLRLRGAYVSEWRLRRGWAVRGEPEPRGLLHFMREGEAAIRLGSSDEFRLQTGDLAIFPRGAAHEVSQPGVAQTRRLDSLLPNRPPGRVDALELGTGAQIGTMLCAGLDYDVNAEYPLYQTLPDVLLISAAQISESRTLVNLFDAVFFEVADLECASTEVTLRIFELIFILGLRASLESLDPPAPISRALRHPEISRVLLAIYEDYAQPWNLDDLAALAHMSRASFSAKFKGVVGESPGRHLRRRRMMRARELLQRTAYTLDDIAHRVGYESSVGFHLAFRQEFGVPPGVFRKKSRLAPLD